MDKVQSGTEVDRKKNLEFIKMANHTAILPIGMRMASEGKMVVSRMGKRKAYILTGIITDKNVRRYYIKKVSEMEKP